MDSLERAMRAQYEDEVRRLAETLGGGWRFERGIMPMVTLTVIEAQNLEKRIRS